MPTSVRPVFLLRLAQPLSLPLLMSLFLKIRGPFKPGTAMCVSVSVFSKLDRPRVPNPDVCWPTWSVSRCSGFRSRIRRNRRPRKNDASSHLAPAAFERCDPTGRDVAVGQNQWCHFGVGEFTTHFSGDWDVQGGCGVLTHGHVDKSEV